MGVENVRAETSEAERALDPALAALFDTNAAGIAKVDFASSRFVRVNRRFCEIMRRDAATLLTLGPPDVIHPEDAEAVKQEWRQSIFATGKWEGEVRHIAPDGREFWVRIGASVWKRDGQERLDGCVAVVQDITESMRIKEQLRHDQELLRLGQRIGRIGTFERDLRSGRLYASAETRLMFGFTGQDLTVGAGEWTASFLAEDQECITRLIAEALARRDEEIAIEARIRRADDGGLRHLEMRARYYYDEAGRPLRSVGVIIDVSERKLAEERLSHAAHHDALTGLPNRVLLRDRLAAATLRLEAGEPFAVICLDLDRFKDVNDTLGHPFGDKLLVEVGRRLSQELGPRDTLARLGGDEFAVLFAGPADGEEAGRLAERLVARIGEPFQIEIHRIVIGASAGVAVAPQDGVCGEELLSAADLALYQAKAGRTASGWRRFDPQMNAQAQLRRDLERDLRAGMARGEFELFYQPVLDSSTLKIDRFEALIRWRHPERGLVPPAEFIPLCEETGLITPLGAWVLRRACADAASWPPEIGVAVNVSAVQVAAGDLNEIVAAALKESGLRADRLEVEITETVLLNQTAATLATMHALQGLGVRIAMDDFGAGHSSLGYLQSFPFDKVKIDRVFAASVDSSKKSAAIVKAILDLCKALGMTTTIEGVETQEQFKALSRMGGERLQGYLFSPPRPAACVPELLAQFGGAAELARAAE